MKHVLLRWRSIAEQWPALTFYQRFESGVAFALTLIISLVIVVALFRLIIEVVGGLVLGALNPLEHMVFQSDFGEILTVLIALEFNHTLQYFATREQSVIQTKIVLLIALLALARKVIILDLQQTTPTELLGLAAVTLALGMSYWLLRERDDRLLSMQAQRPPDSAATDSES